MRGRARDCGQLRAAVALGLWLSFVPSAHSLPAVQYPGYSVDLLASGFGAATGLALSPSGDLYVTDDAGFRVLRVQNPSSAGPHTAEVYATGILYPNDLSFAFGGRLFVTSSTGPRSQIIEVLSNGSTQVFASGFSFPVGIAAFGDSLYVGNSGNGTISKVDNTGAPSAFLMGFSGPNGPFGLSFDAAGKLYFMVHGTGAIYRADPDGSTTLIGNVSPFGGTFTGATPDGKAFVTDVLTGDIDLIDSTGLHLFASGFAGKSNPPYNGPNDVAIATSGTLYVADADNVWRLTPVPEPATLALLGLALAGLGFARRRELR